MTHRFGLRLINCAAVALLALAVTGCSLFESDEEKEQRPAPLPELQEELVLDKVWSSSVGDGQGDLYNRLVPAISQEKIIVASAKGKLEAFDRLTGKSLWDIDLDEPLTGGVGVGEGLVLVASADGKVWALRENDGAEVWHSQVDGQVLAPPQAKGKTVAVLTFSGNLIGLDTANGVKQWNYATGAPVLSLRASAAPLMADEAVYAGFGSGKVVAVERETGRPLWETRIGFSQGSSEIERQVDVDGDMLLSSGTLYAVSFQGHLTALDADSGRRKWEHNASSYVGLSEGISNIYVAGANGNITAFTKDNQGVRWEQTALARRQLSGAAVWNDAVVVGDVEGYVHLLSEADGRFVGRVRVDSDGVRVAPLVVDDLLYVFGNSGTIAAYRLEQKK
jgi:outer membrane protein assembly factor BamB